MRHGDGLWPLFFHGDIDIFFVFFFSETASCSTSASATSTASATSSLPLPLPLPLPLLGVGPGSVAELLSGSVTTLRLPPLPLFGDDARSPSPVSHFDPSRAASLIAGRALFGDVADNGCDGGFGRETPFSTPSFWASEVFLLPYPKTLDIAEVKELRAPCAGGTSAFSSSTLRFLKMLVGAMARSSSSRLRFRLLGDVSRSIVRPAAARSA